MLLGALKGLFKKSPVGSDKEPKLEILDLITGKDFVQAKNLLQALPEKVRKEPEIMVLSGLLDYYAGEPLMAEEKAMNALKMQPGLAEGHYVLSLVYYEAERFQDAYAQAQFARNCMPGNARYLAQLGLCCIAMQKFGAARDVLRQAVLLEPDNVPALNNLGIAHHALTEYERAIYQFRRALALDPGYKPAIENLRRLFNINHYSSRFNPQANMLESSIDVAGAMPDVARSGDGDEIARDLEERLDEHPDDVDVAERLIEHYLDSLNLEAARDVLYMAMAHNPLAVQLLSLAGRMAHMLGQLTSARRNYEQALVVEPDNVNSLLGLGQVLRDLGLLDDAIRPVEQAVVLRADAQSLTQLAYSQVNACRYEDALRTCDRIDAEYPHISPFLHSSRAVCHAYLGHFDKAYEFIDQAQVMELVNPAFAVFRGLLDLLHENYKNGWEGYRYRSLNEADHLRLLPFPIWQGENLRGKTLLLLAEQGLGDQVMFASCLQDLLALEPKCVLLEANARVAKTLARSFPGIQVFPSGQQGFDWLPKDVEVNCYLPIADLARFFRGAKEDFPDHSGYLKADEARVEYWRKQLGALNGLPKIGITWKGGMQQTRRAVRSLQLDQMDSLLLQGGYQFVNLQYGDVRDEIKEYSQSRGVSILDWPEAIQDLDEFAALISSLDLVITVCNTTVHYAGALGKACWVMTPFIPEWRYGIDSQRMRWYPSTRMFRQRWPGDWEGVLASVSEALNDDSSPL